MNVVNHSYEYRDNFKKSLRSYERSATNKAQRPIFSAMHGRKNRVISRAIEDQRIFGDFKLKKEDRNLRKSLQHDRRPDELVESDEASPLK